jgi:uncharacterized membrane protein
MLKLEDYKVVFASVGLIGVLLFASPTLGLVLHLPGGEKFSELWVLGPGHMTEDYPFNVRAGEEYLVYVGVGNHMGSSSYYVVYVKFRNQTEPLPNATAGTPSPLPTLYEYRVVISDGGVWEAPLTFSISKASMAEGRCFVDTLNINNVTFTVNKPALWDVNSTGYYYQLFIELWIYNIEHEGLEFHNRFVGIWLNMTS